VAEHLPAAERERQRQVGIEPARATTLIAAKMDTRLVRIQVP
jgi:hypothetical protein